VPKPIPTKVHGVLDYVTALTLIVLPRLLSWSAPVTMLLTVLGVTTVIYSLVTRYELGVAKLLPMKGHLALDAISGLGLLVAAFLVPSSGNGEMTGLIVLGLFELAVTLLSETHPSSEMLAADRQGVNDTPSGH
jgi:hypothetical protein